MKLNDWAKVMAVALALVVHAFYIGEKMGAATAAIRALDTRIGTLELSMGDRYTGSEAKEDRRAMEKEYKELERRIDLLERER